MKRVVRERVKMLFGDAEDDVVFAGSGRFRMRGRRSEQQQQEKASEPDRFAGLAGKAVGESKVND